MSEASARIVSLYERTAAAFDRARDRSLFERAWLERFLALAPAHGAVLDLGCGVGEPIAAAIVAAGRQVTGVDSSLSMIALCRARLPNETWVAADMRDLALGRAFDGVLAWDSFFHLTPADQRAAFAVFGRHAAVGAPLMFTSGPAAGEAIGEWQGEALYHASLAPDEYAALLDAHGFALVDMRAEDKSCGGRTIWLARKI